MVYDISWLEKSIDRFKLTGGNGINEHITIGEFIRLHMSDELEKIIIEGAESEKVDVLQKKIL